MIEECLLVCIIFIYMHIFYLSATKTGNGHGQKII